MAERNGAERLQAIPVAIAARDTFLDRVKQAATKDESARLMAEAVDMHLAANGLEPVGRDGRSRVCVEEICASHCLKAAREAYARYTNARGEADG